MENFLSFVFCVINLCASFKNPSICYEKFKSEEEEEHKALFVFGDSLFDPGNNQYLNGSTDEGTQATSWPYGQSFFDHPTGRLSDGRIVPDFIAQFANLPLLPPYLESSVHPLTDGANFASAGAGVLAGTHPGTIHIRKQLEYFKSVKNSLRQQLNGEEEAEKFLRRAVYLFSIGGNDYFDFYTSNPNATQSNQRAYVDMVVGNLTLVLKELYGLGARKIGFQNAGPLGCVPVMKSMDPELAGSNCLEQPLALARLHNEYLSISLDKLQKELPGFKHAIFDYYNSLRYRVNNSSKYGFKEGKVACCGSGAYNAFGCGGRDGAEYELCSKPSEYVWFDGAHTTEMANRQLAELLWSGDATVTGPYNMKQLFQHS